MKARIIGGVAAVAIGVVVFALTRDGTSASTTAAPATRSETPAWAFQRARDFESGVERRYAVELDHTSRQIDREPFTLSASTANGTSSCSRPVPTA